MNDRPKCRFVVNSNARSRPWVVYCPEYAKYLEKDGSSATPRHVCEKHADHSATLQELG